MLAARYCGECGTARTKSVATTALLWHNCIAVDAVAGQLCLQVGVAVLWLAHDANSHVDGAAGCSECCHCMPFLVLICGAVCFAAAAFAKSLYLAVAGASDGSEPRAMCATAA
jgi:hypothetical protein